MHTKDVVWLVALSLACVVAEDALADVTLASADEAWYQTTHEHFGPSDITLLSESSLEDTEAPHPNAALKAADEAARKKAETETKKAADKMKAQLSAEKANRREAAASRAKKRAAKWDAKKALREKKARLADAKRKKAQTEARLMRHKLSKAKMADTKATAKVNPSFSFVKT